jgi:hypothetical protein
LINKSFNLKQHLKICNISSFMILILINFFKISGVRFIIHSRGPHRLLKQKPNEQGTPTNKQGETSHNITLALESLFGFTFVTPALERRTKKLRASPAKTGIPQQKRI